MILRIILTIIGFLLIAVHPVYPNEPDAQFQTSFDVGYTIQPTGVSRVTMQGRLTNTSDHYYASSYTLTTGFTQIEHITAQDGSGPIKVTVDTDDNMTSRINLTFNQQVTGKGNTLAFSISFDTREVAEKAGNIWEIHIPGFANQAQFTSFRVQVDVPSSFGKASILKPSPREYSATRYVFTKSEMGESGIAMTFGDKQIYAYTLSYHLYNPGLIPSESTIALPADTAYQTVWLESIEPSPSRTYRDEDGNWLAVYALDPSQRMEVIAKGAVVLSLTPRSSALDPQRRQHYLKEQPYWEINDPSIQQLARELKTVDAIYRYVSDQLTYDFSRVTQDQTRLGAKNALRTPTSAVCLEFTDLFIALSRAAGIPAREINGYAHTENRMERPLSLVTDILHAWPEYYDDATQTWIMVDPTWQSTTKGIDYFTTFDFDHIAFVTKGMRSDYPIPAGGYKLSKNEGKDVHISFTRMPQDEPPQLSITLSTSRFWSGKEGVVSVAIQNTGKRFLPPQTMQITNPLLPPTDMSIITNGLPPLGTQSIPLMFDRIPLLTNTTLPITILIAGTEKTAEITISPFFLQYPLLYGSIAVVIISVILIWLAPAVARRVSFLRRR